MINKKIKNLQIRRASYLGDEPEHPAYHIDKWEPNQYYKKEYLYIEDGDYYKLKEPEYSFMRIHKNCFKNKETCYAIASFEWDSHEKCYEFRFIGDRPLQLDKEEQIIFWKLIVLGYNTLNKEDEL